MATVYLAVDERLDREVALKVMRQHLTHDESFVTRFRREARSSASLSHPNVVAVYDQGEDDGRIFLAMEYVPGQTLRDVMREEGLLSPRAALDVLEPVLHALAEAHAGPDPPRRQARERHHQRQRHGQGRRLRAGPRRDQPDRHEHPGRAARHRRLPLPRAGRARHRRRPQRRLRGRADALRDAHRHQGVHRRHRHPRRLPARARRGAHPVEPGRRPAAGARRPRRRRHRPRPRRPAGRRRGVPRPGAAHPRHPAPPGALDARPAGVAAAAAAAQPTSTAALPGAGCAPGIRACRRRCRHPAPLRDRGHHPAPAPARGPGRRRRRRPPTAALVAGRRWHPRSSPPRPRGSSCSAPAPRPPCRRCRAAPRPRR